MNVAPLTTSESLFPADKHPSQHSLHIGIAGAGLMGRIMAWQLLRLGHQVTLFDQDIQQGEASAARVAAAMLAPFSEAVSTERMIFDWGIQALQQWPELLQQLKTDCGESISFQQRGSIIVAHTADQNDLDFFNLQLQQRLPDQQQHIECCNRQRLQELEPELTQNFSSAIYLQQEGCLDNWALLDNLALAIDKLGATWHQCVSATTIQPNLITTNEPVDGQHQHHFDIVLDTRGLGAKTQLKDLRGVRGEVLWVQAPEVKLTRPVRLMHPRYQLYIAPKPNNLYVIGATEIESESMAPITVRSSLELQSALFSLHTGFAEATIVRAFANCRPAFLDNLPRIDCQPGLISINGLYRHGYLLAPFVLESALSLFNDNVQSPIVKTMT